MADTNKMEQAAQLIADANTIGCVPSIQGNWVVWSPPLPADMLMKAIGLSNEIADQIAAPTQGEEG